MCFHQIKTSGWKSKNAWTHLFHCLIDSWHNGFGMQLPDCDLAAVIMICIVVHACHECVFIFVFLPLKGLPKLKWSSKERLTGTSGTLLAQLRETADWFFSNCGLTRPHRICTACWAELREKWEVAWRESGRTTGRQSLTLRKGQTAVTRGLRSCSHNSGQSWAC